MVRVKWVKTSFDAGRLAAERHHLEVQSVLQPEFVHDADDLKCQHVLTKVVTRLQYHSISTG